MSGKELSMFRQNKIIELRKRFERGEVAIPDYQKLMRELGVEPESEEFLFNQLLVDGAAASNFGREPDVKTANIVGRFSLWLRKIKHTLTDEPHYYFMLTWEEAQKIIDVMDPMSPIIPETPDISAKMSEQLKWQAEGPK